MACKIFISYRRGDRSDSALAIQKALQDGFAPNTVFFDRASLKPGDVFHGRIQNEASTCDVFIAVIGPDWLNLLDGKRGVDDVVVDEIRLALIHARLIIPVLVEGAQLPSADVLPEAIKALTLRQAFQIKSATSERDCKELLRFLRDRLTPKFTRKVLFAFTAIGLVTGLFVGSELGARYLPRERIVTNTAEERSFATSENIKPPATQEPPAPVALPMVNPPGDSAPSEVPTKVQRTRSTRRPSPEKGASHTAAAPKDDPAPATSTPTAQPEIVQPKGNLWEPRNPTEHRDWSPRNPTLATPSAP